MSASLFDGLNLQVKRNSTRLVGYETLQQYVQAWANGIGHHALVILGRPGILKSSVLRTVFPSDEERLYVEGSTGPLALYRDLFLNLDRPLVLDDVKITEQLRPVLQSLFDNYDTHTLRWASSKPLKVRISGNDSDDIEVEEEDDGEDRDGDFEAAPTEDVVMTLPTSFRTRTRCCVITNTVERLRAMEAMLDRTYIIDFDPPTSAVLERCQGFVDPDVWAWAKRHERLLPYLSVRDLVQVGIDKQMGMPWEKILRERYFDTRTNLGAYLEVLDDPNLTTGEERWNRFAEMTGKDRATFYRIQQEYRRMFPAPNLPRGRSRKRR